MSLLEVAGAPFVFASGSSIVTSASFTPISGALLVAVTANSNGAPASGSAVAVTDSSGFGSWRKLVQRASTSTSPWADCSVWVKDAGQSPPAMTVTATAGAGVQSPGLIVRQFTGAQAAGFQTGATAIQTTQSEVCHITPTSIGSAIVGAFGSAGDQPTWVGNASTSIYGQNAGVNGDSVALFELVGLTASLSTITLGFSNAAEPNFQDVFALAEILPAEAPFPPEASYGDAAINETFDRLVSYALQGNRFKSVNQHEPKNAPGNGPACSVWIQRVRPLRSSGQAATSIVVVFNVRMYVSFTQQPYDMIDPQVTAATTQFMAALSGDFQFSSAVDVDVRHVDLLGASGIVMEAQAGYMEIDRHMYRVMTLTVPVIINDAFKQVA